jgi:hypothetical protein
MTTSAQRRVQLPSGPVLVGVVYAVTVLLMLAIFTGDIIFGDGDPHRDEGPIDSLIAIGIVGTTALVIGVALTLWFIQTADRARVGSYVLLALSVLTIVFFWSGLPGILGACAAWCAGLTRGARPLGGGARVAGLVGAFIALLNVVLTLGGMFVTAVT